MSLDLTPIWISLKTAATATVITFFLGLWVARGMAGYRGRTKGLIDGLLLLPLVLSPSVVGFILLVLFGRNGPLGWLLSRVGASVVFSWPATVIAATVVAFPLMYKTAAGAFEQVDANVIQAARTLGASEWRVLWRVTLPLAWPGIMAGVSLAFARALGEFGATLMLAGNIPGVTQTLPIAVYFAVEGGAMTRAALWTAIVVAISLTVIAALHYGSRYQRAVPEGAKPSDVDLTALDFGQHGNRALASQVLNGTSAALPDLTSPPSLSHAESNRTGPSGTTGLSVDIEKELPDFRLKVAFASTGAPLGLLGVSGAGKTMTLRAIAGLESPERGRVVLNGRVLFDSELGINVPSRERRIGLVFQNYALFRHMTVANNIAFGLGRLTGQEKKARVRELLELVHLEGFENRRPRELSGGEQQRVALARALAIRPDAILLDEPLVALDTYLRSQMELQLIEALAAYRGVTLYVTHNLEEAFRISRDLIVLSKGRDVACGPKEAVFARPPSYVVARVTGCKNLSHARKVSADGVEALDWGCTLRVAQPMPSSVSYVGIRAHHLAFSASPGAPNVFPCRLVRASETPFRMTLYLRLEGPLAGGMDHHLEAEVFKERWMWLKERPAPWYVALEPERLFVMSE